jgi:hypothetical protein
MSEQKCGTLRHSQQFVNCSANPGFAGDGLSRKLQCQWKYGSSMEHDSWNGSDSAMLSIVAHVCGTTSHRLASSCDPLYRRQICCKLYRLPSFAYTAHRASRARPCLNDWSDSDAVTPCGLKTVSSPFWVSAEETSLTQIRLIIVLVQRRLLNVSCWPTLKYSKTSTFSIHAPRPHESNVGSKAMSCRQWTYNSS